MKTKTVITLPLAILLLCAWGPCATIQTGNDPVVVRAETTSTSAHDTFDSFLQLEYNNKAYVKENLPEVHKFAENLRKNRQKWETSLRDSTKAYKQNRDANNKANLDTAIAVLNDALRQIPIYTAKINTQAP
jgi:predicted outer membrane protein